MRLSSLIRLWVWVTVLAVLVFAALAFQDNQLRVVTGFGTADLQSAADALAYKRIFTAWIDRSHAAAAGFCLGFDYLFMPLYAMSFYLSAILAREAFTPKRGLARRAMDYLGYLPFVGALADACENALQFTMLASGATDSMARSALIATEVKWTCAYIGLALLAAGIAGVVKLRWKKTDEPPSQGG